MEVVRYYANGLQYELREEKDGWWSIYRWNYDRGKYLPVIQACSLEKAKDYCDLCEPVPVLMKKLC